MSEIITIILAKTKLPELIFFLKILNLRYFVCTFEQTSGTPILFGTWWMSSLFYFIFICVKCKIFLYIKKSFTTLVVSLNGYDYSLQF